MSQTFPELPQHVIFIHLEHLHILNCSVNSRDSAKTSLTSGREDNSFDCTDTRGHLVGKDSNKKCVSSMTSNKRFRGSVHTLHQVTVEIVGLYVIVGATKTHLLTPTQCLETELHVTI